MKRTKLRRQSIIRSLRALSDSDTHVAKKVAVPISSSDGLIKISSDATQAATEQRKRTFRSRALKWSSHPGSFLRVLEPDASLPGIVASPVLVAGDGPSRPGSCRGDSDMGSLVLDHLARGRFGSSILGV